MREVMTWKRRVRAVVNQHTGRLVLQQWHIDRETREVGWHGIPWPEIDHA